MREIIDLIEGKNKQKLEMSIVYLIPSFLADHATQTIPNYVLDAVKNSQVIFAENERTARRFLKEMDKSIVIDEFEWHTIHKIENEQIENFKKEIGRAQV